MTTRDVEPNASWKTIAFAFAPIGFAAGWSIGRLALGPEGHGSIATALEIGVIGALVAIAVAAAIARVHRGGAFGALIVGAPMAGGAAGAVVGIATSAKSAGVAYPIILGIVAGLVSLLPLGIVYRAWRRLDGVRRASVLEGAFRRHVLFAAFASIALWALVMPASAEANIAWIGVGATSILAGLFLLDVARGVPIVKALRRVVRVSDQGAEISSSDPVIPAEVAKTDLGAGDERWVDVTSATGPYRSNDRVTRLFLGNKDRVVAAIYAAFVVQAVVVLFVFARVRLMIMSSVEALPALQQVRVPPAPEPVVIPSAGAWYPQSAPILTSLGLDEFEDVIGLRWDSNHEERALSIAANDGSTFRTVWRTEPIKSQWASSRTRLLMSGDRLFLTDSEGFLHIYERLTGARVGSAIEVKIVEDACAAPDGAGIWILDHDDWAHRERGLLVDGEGKTKQGNKPAGCKASVQTAASASAADEKCTQHQHGKGWSYAKKDGEVGVIFGSMEGSSVRGETHLWGYEPKTCKDRWDTPLALPGDELHVDPHVHSELANGKVYGFYQLKDGTWTLGARDARTGDVAWRRKPSGALHGSNFESMSLSATRLYLARDWKLEVFDASTGEPLGTVR